MKEGLCCIVKYDWIISPIWCLKTLILMSHQVTSAQNSQRDNLDPKTAAERSPLYRRRLPLWNKQDALKLPVLTTMNRWKRLRKSWGHRKLKPSETSRTSSRRMTSTEESSLTSIMPSEQMDSLDHRHGAEVLSMLADGLDHGETYGLVLPPIESRHTAAPRRNNENSARSRRVAGNAAVMKMHREKYEDLKHQAEEAKRTLEESNAARDLAAAQLRQEEEELNILMARVYDIGKGVDAEVYQCKTGRKRGSEDLHWHAGDEQHAPSTWGVVSADEDTSPAALSKLHNRGSQTNCSSGDQQQQQTCHSGGDKLEKKAQCCIEDLCNSLTMLAQQGAPCWLDCYNRVVDDFMGVLREEMTSMDLEDSGKKLNDILRTIDDELSRPTRELPRSLLMPKGVPPPLPLDELCEALQKQLAAREAKARERARISFDIARAHKETKEALKNERAYHAALAEEFSRDFEIGERQLQDLREQAVPPGGDEWWMASFHAFLLKEMREIQRQIEIDDEDLNTIATLERKIHERGVGASTYEIEREVGQLVSRRHVTDRTRLRTIQLWLEKARADIATQGEERCESGEPEDTLIPYHCQLSRAETETSYCQTDLETYVSSWKAWQGERELTDGARIEATVTYRRNNEDLLLEVTLDDMSHPLFYYIQVASVLIPSLGILEQELGLVDSSRGGTGESSRSTPQKENQSEGKMSRLGLEELLKEAATGVAGLVDVDYGNGLPVVSLRGQYVAWRDGSLPLKSTTKKIDEMVSQGKLVELVSQDVLFDGIQLPVHASLFVPQDPLVVKYLASSDIFIRLLELKLPPIATSVIRVLRMLNVECNATGMKTLASAQSRGSDLSLWIGTSKRIEALVRAMLVETDLFRRLVGCPTLVPTLTLTEISVRGALAEEDTETLGFCPLAIEICVHPDGRLCMTCTRQQA